MMTRATGLIALLLVPILAGAATFSSARTLILSEIPNGNAYVAGGDVRVTAASSADLVAAGGTVTVLSPVAGDLMVAGGTIDIQERVGGDVRLAGGQVHAEGAAGDLLAAGGVVRITGETGEAHLTGASVEHLGGARGPVTIYATSAVLAGEFDGDVTVTVSDRLTLGEGTVIRGALRYNAPQEAAIPASAEVGEVIYTGSSFFLPTAEEARTFALAGLGVLFVVRLVSALLAAGVMGALFPSLAQAVGDRALARSVRHFALLALLGFGIIVATPILLFLLAASFVGLGIAFIVGAAYLLLLLLSYIYAAVIAGAALMRAVTKRATFYWRDAVLGMLVLQLVGPIPFVGALVVLILVCAAAGSLIALAYARAFPPSALEE